MHILTDSLLRNYPPIGGLVRPRRNVSEVVEVNTNFSIERIYTVDEFQQSVEFRMLSTMVISHFCYGNNSMYFSL